MNKFLKIFLYFLGFLLVLWTVGRFTGTFQQFTVPTTSSEPAIKRNSRLFASNLVTPKRFDHICFYALNKDLNDEFAEPVKEIWVHRLVGIAGDVIEIEKGDLLVNNQPVDNKLQIQNMYWLRIAEFEKIKDSITIEEWMEPDYLHDSVSVALEEKFIKNHQVKAVREVYPPGYEDPYIFKTFGRKWNLDNFGPITVSTDKYFVLGDNRHNAQDSRFIGFVDKKDFVGTALWK